MSTHPEMTAVAPIILDPDYNPFLSNSGYESGLEIGEILNGYSTACSAPPIAAPLHAFPRSLSNSSNMSASSIDSVDGYHVGEEDWIHPYSYHGSMAFPMDHHMESYHNMNDFGHNLGPYETVQVLSAPLMSSSYSQGHEPQHPQPLPFHHHLTRQPSSGSPALLPSSIPPTPPLSCASSVAGGPTGSIHHHQFAIQPRPPFKRAFQSESGPSPHSPPMAKRRKSVSGPIPSGTPMNPKSPKQTAQLTDDDNLLLRLKDEENLPWKMIQKRFLDSGRGEFKVPTLQMRYKRLKEKMRVWEVDDVGYLKEAKDAVSKEFWELVSKKMVDMGCKKKIPGVACERKWRELDGGDQNRDNMKSGSPKLMQGEDGGMGMASPPATRSPSRRSSVSGQGVMMPPAPSVLPLPSSVMQQMANAQSAAAAMNEVVQIKRELCTVAEGDEMLSELVLGNTQM